MEYAYCYVNRLRLKLEYKRTDARNISLSIDPQVYALPFDERDTRTLIVFDGRLPYGGLPKGASIIHVEGLPRLVTKHSNFRPAGEYEDEHLPYTRHYAAGGAVTGIYQNRFFVLAPTTKVLFVRFRDRSLFPIFVSADIQKGRSEEVVWHHVSSY